MGPWVWLSGPYLTLYTSNIMNLVRSCLVQQGRYAQVARSRHRRRCSLCQGQGVGAQRLIMASLRLIDALVYELYGLIEEKIKVVEGK